MPLFFLIAGFFACLLNNKHGVAGLVKNRLLRVSLPFVLFLPMLWAATFTIFGWALGNVEHKSPLLAYIAAMPSNPKNQQQAPTTMHLWFLYYLTLFYGITAIAVRLGKFDTRKLLPRRPAMLLAFLPIVSVPALLMTSKPFTAPEHFTPDIWACWYFGFFYTLGWMLYSNGAVLDVIKPCTPYLVLTSLATYGLYFYLLPERLSLEAIRAQTEHMPTFTLSHCILAVLEAYISVYLVLLCLVWGKAFLNRENRAIRLIADSSYWIYLVHIPLLFAIQFVLLDIHWPLIVEFGLSSFATLIIAFISYLAFVRWTPIGWLLNGRRTKVVHGMPKPEMEYHYKS